MKKKLFIIISIFMLALVNSYAQTADSVSSSNQVEIYDWYTSIGMIQLRTKGSDPALVCIDIAFAYKKGDKVTSNELKQRSIEIKDFLRNFFSKKTADELKDITKDDELKNELKKEINKKILSSGTIKDVVFLQKDIIEKY